MAKYAALSDQLKKRILQGDYAIQGLGAERQLAIESGVSYMTARRALQQLIDEGLLYRGPNGRVEVSRSKNGQLQIAFLAPSFPSGGIERWRNCIIQAAERIPAIVRPILYTHWDDPIVSSTLDSFDGTFLLSICEPVPPQVLKRLQGATRPLVILEEDFTPYGIPAVRHFSPVFVQRLLDHLEERGFRNIDCFNVQPHHEIIEQRIAQWRLWMAAHHFKGQLYDEPVRAYDDPFSHAYMVMKKLLEEGKFHSESLLCITGAAAIGATRALHEAGIRSGVDVGICAVGGEGVAAFQIPSLTVLEEPDVTPYIKLCLDWIARGGGAWSGPLLMQPEAVLAVRESTALFQRKDG